MDGKEDKFVNFVGLGASGKPPGYTPLRNGANSSPYRAYSITFSLVP